MGKKTENKRSDEKNKKVKKHKFLKKIVLMLICIILILGAIFVYKVYQNGWGLSGMLATIAGHDENTKKNLGELKVLLLGISTDQENVDLTDTIMVASYNPNTQKATLLSIPRDTYIGKNSAKATAYEKINSLYSRKHRPDETLEAVREITGLDLNYYAVIKNEALVELVDAIGGVTFDVPIDMKYDDPTQDLHIDLKAGNQLLDGDKAEQLVRFRHNNNYTTYPEEYGDNDTGRMRTQRDFIIQTIKQTAKPENIFKLKKIIDIAESNIITNLDFSVLKDYIPYAVEFNTENMLTATLPGENTNKNSSGTWVFVYDKKETAKLIQEIFRDRDIKENDSAEGQTNLLDNNNVNELKENKTNTNTNTNTNTSNIETNSAKNTNTLKSEVKIEVLNGSGEGKILQKVVEQLNEAGYKVTRTGSTNVTSNTAIINKKDANDSIQNNIKQILGVGSISTSQSNSSKVDITIIIGKDYKEK